MSDCQDCGSREERWVHLTTAANEIEFGMLKGLLEMGNIPAMGRSKGADQFVAGFPIEGIEVSVPEDKYEEALQLLSVQVDEEALEEAEEATEGMQEDEQTEGVQEDEEA